MLNSLKCLALTSLALALSGCRCYGSYDAAWQACNSKYNGKCSYLGDDFKVCKNSIFTTTSYEKCIEITDREGIDKHYCGSEYGQRMVFENQ